jgi:hypothetical protein
MVGGVAEYLSLITGFRMLLLLIALCYVGALVARRVESIDPEIAGAKAPALP